MNRLNYILRTSSKGSPEGQGGEPARDAEERAARISESQRDARAKTHKCDRETVKSTSEAHPNTRFVARERREPLRRQRSTQRQQREQD